MMGLEPTTFCMANASDGSRPFAPVRSNRLFAAVPLQRANGSEPERTPNLAILATTPAGPRPPTSSVLEGVERTASEMRGGRSSIRALAHDTELSICTPARSYPLRQICDCAVRHLPVA
jgi:hypothetical protein